MEEILRTLLIKERRELNARFAALQRSFPNLHPDCFLDFLENCLLPLLNRLARRFPDALPHALSAWYDQALQLSARGWTGENQTRLWQEIFPGLLPLLARDPRGVSARLANALLKLEMRDPCLAQRWLDRMEDSSCLHAGVEELNAAGLLAAWCSGCPEYRLAALAEARRLPGELIKKWLDCRGEIYSCLQAWQADPWHAENGSHSPWLVGYRGGYAGYSGLFRQIPQLRMTEGGVLAGDGQGWWHLLADRFGFAEIPTAIAAELPSNPRAHLTPDGQLRLDAGEFSFPQLANFRQAVCDGSTLYVSLPHSYQIFYLALPGGDLRR